MGWRCASGREEGTGEEEVQVNGGLENVRNKQSRLRERREKEKTEPEQLCRISGGGKRRSTYEE